MKSFLLACLVLAGHHSAASAPWTVSISVRAPTLAIQQKIESQIARHLRSLGDMQIIAKTNSPLFSIGAIAKEAKYDKQVIGYAVCFVYVAGEHAGFRGQSLHLGPGLADICEEAINYFDVEVVEPLRQAMKPGTK